MSKIFCTISAPASSPESQYSAAPLKFSPAFTGKEPYFANRSVRVSATKNMSSTFDANTSVLKKRSYDEFQQEYKPFIVAPRTPIRIAFCNFVKARRLVSIAGLDAYFIPHSQVQDDDDATAPITSYCAASSASHDTP